MRRKTETGADAEAIDRSHADVSTDESPDASTIDEEADQHSGARRAGRTQIYTAQYRERIVLPDGRLVEFRLLKPSDDKRLRRFFEALSERSRTARFLKRRDEVPDEEIRTLVQPSSRTHLAIGLFTQRFYFFDHDLLASAHFASLDSHDHAAEVVICAADSVQGQGLGQILMRRLSEAAIERGIRTFTLSMLSRNDAARALFSNIGYSVQFERVGDMTRGEIALLPQPPAEAEAGTSVEKPRGRFMRWARQRRDVPDSAKK